VREHTTGPVYLRASSTPACESPSSTASPPPRTPPPNLPRTTSGSRCNALNCRRIWS